MLVGELAGAESPGGKYGRRPRPAGRHDGRAAAPRLRARPRRAGRPGRPRRRRGRPGSSPTWRRGGPSSPSGPRGDARVLLLGGVPFPEPIVMWWNFGAATTRSTAPGLAGRRRPVRHGGLGPRGDPRLSDALARRTYRLVGLAGRQHRRPPATRGRPEPRSRGSWASARRGGREARVVLTVDEGRPHGEAVGPASTVAWGLACRFRNHSGSGSDPPFEGHDDQAVVVGRRIDERRRPRLATPSTDGGEQEDRYPSYGPPTTPSLARNSSMTASL